MSFSPEGPGIRNRLWACPTTGYSPAGVAFILRNAYNTGMNRTETYHHLRLDCGVELAAIAIPGRRTATFEIRVLAGLADEPADRLGVARMVEETICKGTAQKTAQELTDAFDSLGAQSSSAVGRESMIFRCSCLPEYVEQALALETEMLRTPAFPDDFCRIALDLAQQELTALEDDPGELSRRLLAPRAYGPLLGRHELGTRESLARITRDDIVSYWRRHFGAARLILSVAGAVDVDRLCVAVERLFAGFGEGDGDGRGSLVIEFSPGGEHHQKTLEQEHILMCWPGASVADDDYPAERLMLAVLGEGMSSRLFTEVREKQGLVYWVGAWDEHPRQGGMIFLGASTRPERADQTVATLLREVERLGEDLTEDELARAKTGLITKSQTHGELTRARTTELSGDLFHYGRPVPTDEKIAMIARVSVDDIRRYLAAHPRGQRCLLTLGPRAMGPTG